MATFLANASRRRRLQAVVLMSLIGLGACQSKSSPSTANSAVAPKLRAAQAFDSLKIPADAVAVIGVDDLAGTLEALGTLLADSAQLPNAELLRGQLAQTLGLTNGSAIDLGRALRILVLGPKKHPALLAVIGVAISARTALEQSLPANRKAGVDGNAFQYTSGAKPVYLNFVDGFAVFSPDAKLFATHREFFQEAFRSTPGKGLGIRLGVAQLLSSYEPEIEAMRVQIQAQSQMLAAIASASPRPPETPPTVAPSAALAQTVGASAKRFESYLSVLRGIDDLGIRATGGADGLRFEATVTPKPGSEVARLLQTAVAAQSSLLSRLPATAIAAVVTALDSKKSRSAVAGFGSIMTNWYAGFGSEKYSEFMRAAFALMDGQSAFAVTGESVSTLSGVGWARVREPSEFDGFRDKSIAFYQDAETVTMYAAQGMTLRAKREAYQVDKVSVDTFAIEVNAAAPQAQLLASIARFSAADYALSGQHLVLAMGANRRASVEAAIRGTSRGGFEATPGGKRLLTAAPAGAFALVYVDMIRIAKTTMASFGLAAAPPVGPVRAPVALEGVTLAIGTVGDHLTMVMDVPKLQIDGIRKLMGALNGVLGPRPVLGGGSPLVPATPALQRTP